MMGFRIDRMVIGVCFFLGGFFGEELGIVEIFLDLFCVDIFCFIREGLSLKVGFGLDRSMCVRGMCSIVYELFILIVLGGFMFV